MTRHLVAAVGVALTSLGLALEAGRPGSSTLETAAAPPVLAVSHTARVNAPAVDPLIDEFCLDCHNKTLKTGGLVLETFDAEHPERNAEIAEKVVRKLRAGLMPPAGNPRPERQAVNTLVTSLETRIDQAAALHVTPGSRPFQRLNRVEYARSIHDLLALDVDVEAYLPPDTVSHGFDNVADVQAFSPALMEGYMRAAARISRLAVGDPKAAPATSTYKVPRTASQLDHVDGTPFGTRGGIAVTHNFPADGTYVFRIALHPSPTGQLFGLTARGEQLEVAINGARVALVDINPRMSESDPNGMNLETPKIAVKAGPQRVSASFIRRFDGPVDDLIEPIEHTLADTQIGTSQGITTLPHLRDLGVTGPYVVTGVSDTPSRRKIFTCHPVGADDQRACATRILTTLASEAYRRPATSADIAPLFAFYDDGLKSGTFDDGIRTALQAMLASPDFVFRLERTPGNMKPGQSFRVTDLELASRLSYFLWASAPDADLVTAASQGRLSKAGGLETQVRRMLADPRAEALATRFASQWLRLQDLDQMHPDALIYPHYDQTLATSMRRETELFFGSIVQEDRDVLDLITADYTFVNEQLAAHYGIPNIAGTAFQRVTLPGDARRGVLGQGSVLVLTSVADRTSPVQRGKWIMEVLLGTPPPPPPPVVPLLEATKSVAGGKNLSVRERMEEHRKDPVCASCHKMMDPLGLALENFDPTGAWRIKDNGVSVDPHGEMYDGTALTGPASLRQALMAHSDVLLRHFTEQLMIYAVGRRVEYFDMPTIRAIVTDAGQHGDRFSSFVLGIVKSPAFEMSQAEDVAPGGGTQR